MFIYILIELQKSAGITLNLSLLCYYSSLLLDSVYYYQSSLLVFKTEESFKITTTLDGETFECPQLGVSLGVVN